MKQNKKNYKFIFLKNIKKQNKTREVGRKL